MAENLFSNSSIISDASTHQQRLTIQNEITNPQPSWNNDEFFELLEDWGLGYLKSKFADIRIDKGTLRYMNENDINQLFPINELHSRIVFRTKLMEWKKVNGYVEEFSIPEVGADKGESPGSLDFNLKEFLNSSIGGQILKLCSTSNPPTLTLGVRDLLVNLIIDEFLKKGEPMVSTTFQSISAQICNFFGGERQEYFYVGGSHPQGKLFQRYKGQKRHFQEIGFIEKPKCENPVLKQKRRRIATVVENLIEKEWLATNNDPWELVLQYWSLTTSNRQHELSSYDEESDGPSKLIQEWPLFKTPNSSLLIEIDFKFLFEGKPGELFSKVGVFEPKIIKILKQKIKNQGGRKLLNQLPEDSDERLMQIFKLIHYFLKPTCRVKSITTTKIWKFSIADSIESVIYNLNEWDILPKEVEDISNKLFDHGMKVHPIIFHCESDANYKFVIKYYDIQYKLATFIECLETCFKLYMIFNLKYPPQSKKFWMFVQQYFFEIKLNQSDPDVISLIEEIEKL